MYVNLRLTIITVHHFFKINFGYEKSFHSFVAEIDRMEPQERILQKAHELFMLYGIRSVSMDEIANHLGISKKTIYQYYPDKDALVESVIGIELSCSTKECENISVISENPIHELFLALDNFQETISMMNPSLIYDLEKYHPKAYKKVNDHKFTFLYEIIKSNLERGVAEGFYREDINIPILTKFRLATVFLIFNQEIFPHTKFQVSNVMDEITDNFLFGIASAKGQKLITKYKQQRIKKLTV